MQMFPISLGTALMVRQEARLLLPTLELTETWWANGAPNLFSL